MNFELYSCCITLHTRNFAPSQSVKALLLHDMLNFPLDIIWIFGHVFNEVQYDDLNLLLQDVTSQADDVTNQLYLTRVILKVFSKDWLSPFSHQSLSGIEKL